jgi:hypothetical protein
VKDRPTEAPNHPVQTQNTFLHPVRELVAGGVRADGTEEEAVVDAVARKREGKGQQQRERG